MSTLEHWVKQAQNKAASTVYEKAQQSIKAAGTVYEKAQDAIKAPKASRELNHPKGETPSRNSLFNR